MAYEDVPFDEINLRSYGNLKEVYGRDLVKKLALSLGLSNPHDNRDVVVDCLHVFIIEKKSNTFISSKDLFKKVSKIRYDLNLSKTSESNIRRIIKQLTDFGLIEKNKAKYKLKDLHDIESFLEYKISKLQERIFSYLKKNLEENI